MSLSEFDIFDVPSEQSTGVSAYDDGVCVFMSIPRPKIDDFAEIDPPLTREQRVNFVKKHMPEIDKTMSRMYESKEGKWEKRQESEIFVLDFEKSGLFPARGSSGHGQAWKIRSNASSHIVGCQVPAND